MTTPNDANSILMGRGSSAKFETIGATVSGTVLSEPTAEQQTDYRTKTPETWKDGSPKMQIVVQLQTNERDPERPNDSGTRTLYIKGKELTNAVRQAVRQSGADGIHTGGTLTVQYAADGPAEAGLNPPKLYAASYQPPAVSFNGVTAPANAPVSPAPVQQAYVPQPVAQQQAFIAPPQVQQPAYVPPPVQQAPAATTAVLGAPNGVDPNVWARLDQTQRDAVLAAMGTPVAAGF